MIYSLIPTFSFFFKKTFIPVETFRYMMHVLGKKSKYFLQQIDWFGEIIWTECVQTEIIWTECVQTGCQYSEIPA